jgi:hypothetical protein
MEAHKRENVADMERSAQSHLIQLRHFAQAPAPTLFSTRLFAIGFDRFYQLNWIRSGRTSFTFFRVNIKADA